MDNFSITIYIIYWYTCSIIRNYFYMRWNDIKKHAMNAGKKINESVVSVTESTTLADEKIFPKKHPVLQWLFLAFIVIIIALGIFILIKLFTKKDNPVLPVEELKTISTFLNENQPRPLTNDQAATINTTINKQVELNEQDIQSINNFVNN